MIFMWSFNFALLLPRPYFLRVFCRYALRRQGSDVGSLREKDSWKDQNKSGVRAPHLPTVTKKTYQSSPCMLMFILGRVAISAGLPVLESIDSLI